MGWLSGWSYAKEISLTGQTGAGTLYQVDLDIGDSAGGDFHCEGHCTNFPQDIEVTDNDGTTLLDFSIEDITADPIKLWVEVADDLGSNQKVWVYYGKSGATTNSDIDETFLFGDDFPGSSLDTTNKWSIKDGSCSVSGGYAQPYGLPVFVITKNYTATNAILHTKFIQTGTYNTGIVFRSTDEQRNVADYYMSYLRTDNTLKLVKMINDARTDFNSKAYTQGAATYEEHITYNGTALDVDIWKGAAADSLSATGDGTRSDGRIGIVNFTNVSEGALKIDYIFTRKYNSPEPVFASAGAEQSVSVGHPVMRRWTGIPGMQYTGRRSW